MRSSSGNGPVQAAIVMNALAESTLTMTDSEILAESCALGHDPDREAEEVRMLLLAAAKSHRQRHLRAARQEYQETVAAFGMGTDFLPSTATARRALLASVFAQHPNMQSAFLTIQHREFQNLSDADVESCLRQLQELGVLEGLRGVKDED